MRLLTRSEAAIRVLTESLQPVVAAAVEPRYSVGVVAQLRMLRERLH